MKKILSIICLLFISIFLFSCDDNSLESEVTILVPNGTPYLAIGGLLENENIKIEVVNGPSNLQSALVSGSFDIVIAPVNLGSNLYNKGNSKYQMSHILTRHNVYIVTKEENKLDNILDLKNQKVLGFGETGIPGSLLKKVYNMNNFDISNIDFQYNSSASVYTVFSGENTESKYALMSEPEISKLVVKDNMKIKTLDLCMEFDSNNPQACIYINPESNNQNDINKVLKLIEENVKYLNTNPDEYVNKIISLDRTFEATEKEVLILSLPKTNIVFEHAKMNKTEVENILTFLGVDLPDEAFYR